MSSVLPEDPTQVFGRRVGAAVIDGLIIGIPTFALVSAQFEYYDAPSAAAAQDICDLMNDAEESVCINADSTVYFSEDVGEVSAAVGLGLLLSLLIHVVLQGLAGWTPGKRFCGIRTVAEDGTRPGIGRAIVRWLLWIVDGQPCGIPLVGFITGLTSTGHRRVGDMVAKTYVVKASAAGSPVVAPGLRVPPGPAAPAPVGSYAPPPSGAPRGGGDTTPPSPPAPAADAAPHPPPTAKPGPQWDEARGTYIQWDPEARLWMQWDEAVQTWNPIPNQ